MKWRVVAVLCLALTLCVGGQVFAQIQVTVTGNMYLTDSPKFVPIDKEHAMVFADNEAGVYVTENGKGSFNNLAVRCIWLDSHDPGKEHWYGFSSTTDKDGDTIFWELHEGSSPQSGKAKILWGSGKFEGIEGTTDYIQVEKSLPDGTRLVIIPNQVWKLTLKKPLP